MYALCIVRFLRSLKTAVMGEGGKGEGGGRGHGLNADNTSYAVASPVVIHPSNAYAQLLMVCRRTAARDLRPLIKDRNSRNNATTNSRGCNSTCGDLETAG